MIDKSQPQPVTIPGHPAIKNYFKNVCYWLPGHGWRVRGSGNPGKPCTWQGHPWGDREPTKDTEGEGDDW